jgi:phospholipid N-methyltransferase
MRRLLADYRLFLTEFRRTFHTTGAILPSSALLARALAKFVADAGAANDATSRPRRILEVGPGTGAVTRRIVKRMRPTDRLDLVELNDQFVSRLRYGFTHDPALRSVGDRTTILHKMVQDLDDDHGYDLIISGLPLNNFAVQDVEDILAKFQQLLRPDGTLSFFEYIAVRPLRGVVSGKSEKQRLRGIDRIMTELLRHHEIRRQSIWVNVPPAWVHHVCFQSS